MKRLILALTCAVLVSACGQLRTPCVYELPDGFSGWVLIEFERANAPPLPKKNGKLIFQIGSDGQLVTSSSPEFGVASDEYYFVGSGRTKIPMTAWGAGGHIWGGSNGSIQISGQKPLLFQNFFVGTEVAFKSSKAAPPQPR